MHRRNDTAGNEHDGEQLDSPVARSYQEVARILAQREGASITPAEVSLVCQAAEWKLAHAAQADPVIDQWLRRQTKGASGGPSTSTSVDARNAQDLPPRPRPAAFRSKRTNIVTSEWLTGNRCIFQVCCASVQQVKLVIARPRSVSRIVSLRPHRKGVWKTVLDLDPGEHHYCYHAYDGRSLTYVAPTDAPLNDFKAVLRVGEASQLETQSRRDCM